jgi:hypothetical protein
VDILLEVVRGIQTRGEEDHQKNGKSSGKSKVFGGLRAKICGIIVTPTPTNP